MNTKPKKMTPSEPINKKCSSNASPSNLLTLCQVEDKTTQKHIEQITNRLFGPGIDSVNRLPAMLNHLNSFLSQPKVFWPVFHAVWNACEVTWEYREELGKYIQLVQETGESEDIHPKDYLTPEDKAAFESLPNRISIYRGCSLSKVYGYSWTTDRKIAERFARGFRGISVPNPVIASVCIPKKLALGYYTSRNESEVFIDRCEIEKYSVTVTKFQRR